ncbi:MAG: phosphatase PAP2 family protein [Odoribacteraceae bacterium]|jgi:undecaprenyl-diphosphatase|nr:phosphatase PAP2 family protein [Odoribacteraceae bacterium]
MWELLQEWDKSLFLFLNGQHAPYWDHFARIFTSKTAWGVMYASILYVLGKNLDWKMVIVTTLAFVLVIVVADQLASSVLRPLFARPRPSRAPGIMDTVHLIDGRRGGAFGFPSAHAANTAALTAFIILLFRHRCLSAFFIAWTLVTCYTRVYVGVHYPGDVLFGILVGGLAGCAVHGAYRLGLARLSLAPAGKMKHLPVIINTGLLTTVIIALYSLF